MPPSDFILLDAARLEHEIDYAKEFDSQYSSLYKGRSEESLAGVAPFLFTISRSSDFSKWFFEKGWGNSWGLWIQSGTQFDNLFKHLRKFLLVKTEGGTELYFRFYDPRVLRIFLPTCDPEQLTEFFGPIEKFICEDEDESFALIFSLQSGNLVTDRKGKEEILDLLSE